MGVHGLWNLLAPVGQRVAIQTLAHKRVAVDVSIWLIQFVKSMRDERGDMMRNAHLLGFFRRICKLLFNRIRPVFVFDGGAPFLKRRTVIARRRLREQSNSKLRKAAEKLLINQLKLRELERSLSNSQTLRPKAQEPPTFEENATAAEHQIHRDNKENQKGKEKVVQKEERESDAEEQHEDKLGYEDAAVVVPEDLHRFDPVALAALPPSMALEVLDQMREQRIIENRSKFQQYSEEPESFSQVQMESYLKNTQFKRKIETVRQQVSSNSTVNGVQTQRVASDPSREIFFNKEKESSIFSRYLPAETKEKPLAVLQDSVLSNPMESKLVFANTSGKSNELLPKDSTKPRPSAKARVEGPFGLDLSDSSESGNSECSEDEFQEEISQGEASDNEEVNATAEKSPTLDHKDMFQRTAAHDIDLDVSLKVDKDDIAFLNEISDEEEEEAAEEEKEQIGVKANEWTESTGNKNQSCSYLASDFSIDTETRASAEGVNCVRTDRLNENGEWGQLPTAKENIATIDSFPQSKAKEADMEPNLFDDTVSHELKQAETAQVASKNKGKDTSGITQILPFQRSDSENSEDSELKAAIQMSILDLQNSNKDDSASSSKHVIQRKESPTNPNNDEDEGYDMELQQAMELSLAASDSKENAHMWLEKKGPDANTTKEVDEGNNDESLSDNEIPAMVLPPPESEKKEVEKVEDRAQHTEKQEENASRSSPLSGKDAEMYKKELLQEETDLRQEIRRQERLSETVTPEMIAEAQELLQLFGIPYIVAPMEAEAQCAQLEKSHLVDAVVTDDGDAFLFGARVVYKNIFEQQKYAELYRIEYVEKEMRLDRENLINLAILLGSDYTEGIHGIGIVNAYEVVTSFSGVNGLKEFRKWLNTPDIQGLKPASGEQQPERVLEFKRKHKGVKKNWEIPPNFPSQEVIDAYASPKVDESTEELEWGRPDVEALLVFCQDRFGWNSAKAKEILDPILAAYEDKSRQTQINEYFEIAGPVAKIRSKRIREALLSSGGSSSLILPANSEDINKEEIGISSPDDMSEPQQEKRRKS